MNTLLKDQKDKNTLNYKKFTPLSDNKVDNDNHLTLEDYEKFKQKTIEKHFKPNSNSKTKHKGFKKKLKLILRKD
jgi:hypothetical protein